MGKKRKNREQKEAAARKNNLTLFSVGFTSTGTSTCSSSIARNTDTVASIPSHPSASISDFEESDGESSCLLLSSSERPPSPEVEHGIQETGETCSHIMTASEPASTELQVAMLPCPGG